MPPRRRAPRAAPESVVQPAAESVVQPAPEPAAGEPPAPSPPPHLADLTLDYATHERFADFHRAVQRGFQEESPDSVIDFDRQFHEPERFFGFRVGERWISTFGAFTRKIIVPGGSWVPTAAVTAVTVTAPYRRRGLLSRMMDQQFADSLRRGEPLAALWASESVIYGRFGYGQAAPRLRLSGNTRSTAFVPEVDLGTGSVDEVTREQFLARAPAVHDAVTAGRPGTMDRPGPWWTFSVIDHEHWREGATALRYLLHYDPDGEVTGVATYRVKGDGDIHGPRGDVRIGAAEATDPRAYARIWRYLFDLDLVRTFLCRLAPPDVPLRHLLADPRAIHTELMDGLYLRVVDVKAALAARRYAVAVDLVIEVVDRQVEHNNASFRLTAGPEDATVRRTRGRPDLTIGIRELGAAYLGGTTMAELHAAGLVAEHRPGAVASASAAFRWALAPFCSDNF